MSKRNRYLRACMAQKVDWLLLSARNPNAFMTRADIILHYVAIRRKTGLDMR